MFKKCNVYSPLIWSSYKRFWSSSFGHPTRLISVIFLVMLTILSFMISFLSLFRLTKGNNNAYLDFLFTLFLLYVSSFSAGTLFILYVASFSAGTPEECTHSFIFNSSQILCILKNEKKKFIPNLVLSVFMICAFCKTGSRFPLTNFQQIYNI